MPVNGATFDPRLDGLYRDGRDLLGDTEWFDAHTHIGQNDPDGRKATAEEIIGGLDQAGHQRALVFAMHEPDGYGPANDAVLAATAASGGRLVPLARVSPHHEDAVAEAKRCLDAGARGFKLHPRSDEFALPHPAVDEIVALADERPGAMAELESDRREVRAALATLPAPQREAVVLAYWGGLTADEIATRSGVPLGTAKSRVRLGLQRMRAELEGRAVAPIL